MCAYVTVLDMSCECYVFRIIEVSYTSLRWLLMSCPLFATVVLFSELSFISNALIREVLLYIVYINNLLGDLTDLLAESKTLACRMHKTRCDGRWRRTPTLRDSVSSATTSAVSSSLWRRGARSSGSSPYTRASCGSEWRLSAPLREWRWRQMRCGRWGWLVRGTCVGRSPAYKVLTDCKAHLSQAKHSSTSPAGYGAVKIFPKLNWIFFGCFDPVNIYFWGYSNPVNMFSDIKNR